MTIHYIFREYMWSYGAHNINMSLLKSYYSCGTSILYFGDFGEEKNCHVRKPCSLLQPYVAYAQVAITFIHHSCKVIDYFKHYFQSSIFCLNSTNQKQLAVILQSCDQHQMRTFTHLQLGKTRLPSIQHSCSVICQ